MSDLWTMKEIQKVSKKTDDLISIIAVMFAFVIFGQKVGFIVFVFDVVSRLIETRKEKYALTSN